MVEEIFENCEFCQNSEGIRLIDTPNGNRIAVCGYCLDVLDFNGFRYKIKR